MPDLVILSEQPPGQFQFSMLVSIHAFVQQPDGDQHIMFKIDQQSQKNAENEDYKND